MENGYTALLPWGATCGRIGYTAPTVLWVVEVWKESKVAMSLLPSWELTCGPIGPSWELTCGPIVDITPAVLGGHMRAKLATYSLPSFLGVPEVGKEYKVAT